MTPILSRKRPANCLFILTLLLLSFYSFYFTRSTFGGEIEDVDSYSDRVDRAPAVLGPPIFEDEFKGERVDLYEATEVDAGTVES